MIRILVVGDACGCSGRLTKTLAKLGAKGYICKNYKGATRGVLKVVEEFNPTVILANSSKHGMSICHTLHTCEQSRHIRVVLFSESRNDDGIKGILVGALEYLPLDVEQDALASVLEARVLMETMRDRVDEFGSNMQAIMERHQERARQRTV